MCLAKVYLKKDNKQELLLESVASMKIVGNKLILDTIFKETKEIEASVKDIDFTNSSIHLE